VSVLEQVKVIVAKQLDKDPSELEETTDLQEAGFESLDVIEMIFNLEDAFKIDIPFNANETDTSQMRTVGDIVRLVETIKAGGAVPKLATKPAPADGTVTETPTAGASVDGMSA
jgi:acyl carrier protein